MLTPKHLTASLLVYLDKIRHLSLPTFVFFVGCYTIELPIASRLPALHYVAMVLGGSKPCTEYGYRTRPLTAFSKALCNWHDMRAGMHIQHQHSFEVAPTPRPCTAYCMSTLPTTCYTQARTSYQWHLLACLDHCHHVFSRTTKYNILAFQLFR